MKKTFFIKTWDQAKLLENPMRAKILSECSFLAQSIQDLSTKLNLNPGSIFNHVNKLKEAGFLTVADGRLVNGIQEKKYLRSAESFDYSKINKSEIEKRNKFIGKNFSKDVEQILERDSQGSARRIEVSLSQEKFEIAQQKITELKDFLLENKQSGDIKTLLIMAVGRLEKK